LSSTSRTRNLVLALGEASVAGEVGNARGTAPASGEPGVETSKPRTVDVLTMDAFSVVATSYFQTRAVSSAPHKPSGSPIGNGTTTF
jgi:hypothetical protein